MTDYELYINDVLCDLPSDESISLVYQSGIFQELDIIQSNRSYNIDLPMTASNIRAIGHAHRPDAESNTPYMKLPARLYKGGMPIFIKGLAAITEINESISIVLTWGNVDNFQPLFDSELRDLADTLYDMGVGSIPWNENSTIVTAPSESSPTPPMGFYAVDFGQGFGKPEYLHPSIMVQKVLQAIERKHGVTIDGIGRLLPTFLLPCVSKNGDEVSGKAEVSKFPTKISLDGNHVLLAATKSPIEGFVEDGVKFNVKGAKVVDILIKANFTTFTDRLDPIFQVCAENTNNQIHSIEPFTIRMLESFVEIEINAVIHLSVKDGSLPNDTEYLLFYLYDGSRTGTTYLSDNFIQLTAYPRAEVHFPSIYPIGVNLPDMSQGDFLASLLALNGLFPYSDKDHPNTIKFMSADDLFANIENDVFVDWSRKVLVSSRRNIELPEGSAFSAGDYAQRNTLDYDNDDEVKADTSGEILIENENLEKDYELADIPFSASNNTSVQIGTGEDAYSISIASIPMYETDKNDPKKVNYKEPSPRILDYRVASSPDETSRWVYGVFNESQRFGGKNGIVAQKYASLQRILKRFRMISVKARLTSLDLYNLKYEVPVYISQFGDFFAIYSIETGANDICECSLVKLNAPGKTINPQYYIHLNGESEDARIEMQALGGELKISFATNGTIHMDVPVGPGIQYSQIDPATGEALFRAPRRTGYGGVSYYTRVSFTIDEDPALVRILTIEQPPLMDYTVILSCPALMGNTETVSFEFMDGAFYADGIVTTFDENGFSSAIPQSEIMQAFGLGEEDLLIDFDPEGILKVMTDSGYTGEGQAKYGNIYIELKTA